MSTELLSADRRSFRVGDVVSLTGPGGLDLLAVVSGTIHQPTPAGLCRCGCAAGEPSGQAILLCLDPEGTGSADGIHTVQASTTRLRAPAQPGTPEQEQQTRMLLGELVNRCVSGQESAERRCEQAQRGIAAVQATIDSMRSYAIDRHREGEICREGLNDFLRAHDLAPYAPTYGATVDLKLRVRVNCDADEQKGDLGWIIREHLTVDSDGSSRLQIDDFSLGYDDIDDIEEID